ncbi:hypothetical protein A8708_16340 [Paenibacillus oryzisoli]|uniref:Uncharacterized protein n=1 Tax=Paenibacillus oryzisoli TaxID=1850517 RepID=A0A197ZX79_9BACL|nr:hypothetical protein A8708_16340 [Paenibacillus oryzisoli]
MLANYFSKNTKKVNDVMKDYKLLSYKLTHRDSAITMKQILEKKAEDLRWKSRCRGYEDHTEAS